MIVILTIDQTLDFYFQLIEKIHETVRPSSGTIRISIAVYSMYWKELSDNELSALFKVLFVDTNYDALREMRIIKDETIFNYWLLNSPPIFPGTQPQSPTFPATPPSPDFPFS